MISKYIITCLLLLSSFCGSTAKAEAQWLTDYDKALQLAGHQGKVVLVNFTGSDWCGWCIKLHKEVFSKDAFEEWADENVILLELDYPNKKQLPVALKTQNKKLQEKYKIKGFPTILLLNGEGEIVGKTGYGKGGPEIWTQSVDKLLEEAQGKLGQKYVAKIDKKWLEGEKDLRVKWDSLMGKDAPSLESLKGWLNSEAINWDDLKGKVVVLDYWATWCGPCVAGIPKLKKLSEKYEDQNVVVLGVHSANGFDKMPAMVKDKEMQYLLAADEDGVVGKALSIKFLPSYFIIDQQGKMFIAGCNRNNVEDAVKELLKAGTNPGSLLELDQAGFPAKVAKTLYAGVDVRGKALGSMGKLDWIGAGYNPTSAKPRLISLGMAGDPATQKQHAKLLKLHAKIADQLDIILIYDGVQATVKKSVESYGPVGNGVYIAFDEKSSLLERLQVLGVPHVLLVSSDGIVRWQGFPREKSDKLNLAKLNAFIAADQNQTKSSKK